MQGQQGSAQRWALPVLISREGNLGGVATASLVLLHRCCSVPLIHFPPSALRHSSPERKGSIYSAHSSHFSPRSASSFDLCFASLDFHAWVKNVTATK